MDKSIGHLKIAFMWGMYYLAQRFSFEHAIYDILLRGGDTDTNACIIGGLLGARDGFEALNQDWVKKIMECNKEKQEKESRSPRPEFLLPSEYLVPLLGALYLNAPKEID